LASREHFQFVIVLVHNALFLKLPMDDRINSHTFFVGGRDYQRSFRITQEVFGNGRLRRALGLFLKRAGMEVWASRAVVSLKE
jgi:hypothetical protein